LNLGGHLSSGRRIRNNSGQNKALNVLIADAKISPQLAEGIPLVSRIFLGAEMQLLLFQFGAAAIELGLLIIGVRVQPIRQVDFTILSRVVT
jgi:hypothetical protein